MKKIMSLILVVSLLLVSMTAITEDADLPVKGISPENILDVLADTEDTFAAITAYYPVYAEGLAYKANLYVENRSAHTLQYLSTICPENNEGRKNESEAEVLPGKHANMALLFECGMNSLETSIKELTIALNINKVIDDTYENIWDQIYKVDLAGKETVEEWPESRYTSEAPREILSRDELTINLWEVYDEDYDFNLCLHVNNASKANKYTIILKDAYLNDCKCEPTSPLFMELYATEYDTVNLKWDTKSLKYNHLKDIGKVDLQFLICKDNSGDEQVVNCTIYINK